MFYQHLRQGLIDDGQPLDFTTRALVSFSKTKKILQAQVIAKEAGVWAADGLTEAAEAVAAEFFGKNALQVSTSYVSGKSFKKGAKLISLKGDAQALLAIERPLLNLASYSCGIATRTHAWVKKIETIWNEKKIQGPLPRLTATRKILPGYRDLAIAAVIAGGGYSHRVSLSGGILLKENHIALAGGANHGGIARAIRAVRATAPHGLKVECEVRSYRELEAAIAAGAEIVMLDNFSKEEAAKALELTRKYGVGVEVSGGITEQNIGDYAFQGITLFSSGALTHSVRALDFSLLVQGS